MKFSPALLEEIKYRNPIEDVVAPYVTLKRSGSTLMGLCPFHSEKTPSFTVSPKNQLFYCFGCGAGGDTFTFLMKAENLDYPSAVRALAQKAGVPLPAESEDREQTARRTRVLEMNRLAARFYHESLASADKAKAYFQKRQLPPATVSHFGLGYAPDTYNALVKYLKKQGYSEEEMIAASLARRSQKNGQVYDFFVNRVIFPIIDTVGNVIAFGGRVMDDSLPKYLNSPDTPAFRKRHNLFALNFAKKHCTEAMILCEGYMDVIALHSAGFQNAVATLGTAITPEQARLMRRYTSLVYICYDSDSAGQRATDKAIGLLTEAGLEVRVLHMEGAKDPDEYLKKFGRDKFAYVLQQGKPQFDFKTDSVLQQYDLDNAEEKIKAAHAVCEVIASVPSALEREVYLNRCAKRLELSVTSLQDDVARILRTRKKKDQAEQMKQIGRQAEGLGDRVNPDKVGNVRANNAEEAILGILLLYPEYVKQIQSGKISLTEADFVTAFHRRVFSEVLQQCKEGDPFDFGSLGENFSPDEIGRITRLSFRRSSLSQNDDKVLQDCIAILKQEKQAAEADLFTILQAKKQKNQPQGS